MIFRRKDKISSDNELMQQVIMGDQTAFGELYQRYKDRMYYYFYRMLYNSPEMANDFLQELFMKLVEKPESYDSRYPFSTWFYSVAHNMCKNEYRRREVRVEYVQRERAEEPFVFPAEETISAELLVEKIFETLETLGGEHRSAFLLRYREGFSVKEIAGILSLPEGTVKSRLFYAKKSLAEKLEHLKNEVDF